jgi:superfamily II DNA or RNA helicase
VPFNPGDRLTVRGADWRLVQAVAHADCTALDLVSTEQPPVSRTLLLPFDRPRAALQPRLHIASPHAWSNHVAALVARTFPYGGLRFVPAAIQLLPYQLEPALAVFRHGASRILVADDVGLGKTIEAALIVLEMVGRKATARVLIVVHAGLKAQWKEELATLFGLAALDADADWLRACSRELPAEVNPWSIPGVFLASMDFVKRPEALSPLECVRWDLLVVDEAHAATPGTDRLTAIDALGSRASTVVLLSATPHSGNPEQFDALCRLGAGESRSPLVCFRRSRPDVDAPENLRSRILAVTPTAEERQMHRTLERYTALLWRCATEGGSANARLLATIFRKRALSSAHSLALSLRRRLLSMGPAVPIESQPWLPLYTDDEFGGDEEGGRVLSGEGLGDQTSEVDAIEHNLRAAEAAAAAESKPLLLLRLLARVREPAIVFSEYRDTALRVAARLGAAGHRVVTLHGGLAADERTAAIAGFNRGGAVMVATDAACEGLNLHRCCRLVIHYELPWSPVRLHQRCGRVNRIGQQRRVHEIALIAADTAEQLVVRPLLRRVARSGDFMRGSFVDQLPDALVAAHVFGASSPGEPAASVTASTSASTSSREQIESLHLESEGRIEAERLRSIRTLQELSSGGSGRAIVAIRANTPGIPGNRDRVPGRGRRQTATVLVSLLFSEAGGEQLEERLVPIAVDYVGRRWRHGGSALRRQVASVLAELGLELRRAAQDVAEGRLPAIESMHGKAAVARSPRRLVLAQAIKSAAREMVQPGLFARRAERPEARAADPDLLDEPVPAQSAPSRIVWQVRTEAVACGRFP